MKFLSVRELRGDAARIWRELPAEREMVVTSNGRPVAVLSAVNEKTVEESLALWRRVRATQAIADIQRASVRKGTDRLTMKEVDAEIAAVRSARGKRLS
jgi:antitoxin (DNA-binding transcriptional repressor) of toxin-antitoxin stability system